MTQGTLAPTTSTMKLNIKSHENSYMPPIYPSLPKLFIAAIWNFIYFKKTHPLNQLLKQGDQITAQVGNTINRITDLVKLSYQKLQ